MTDFETWLMDNNHRIFRYWIYRRMFTPAEQDAKYSDESCFESTQCMLGLIEEAIELPDGDILLGMRDPEDNGTGQMEFYKLSEIRLAVCDCDMEMSSDV